MEHALMTFDEAADYLGRSKETLASWRYLDRGLIHVGKDPAGPRWVWNRTRTKALGYRKADLDAWLEKQMAGAA